MPSGVEQLAEHYQHTYELTLQMWEQRNKTFLLLLGVVGVAVVLTFDVPEAQPLLVDVIANLVGVSENPARVAELRTGFPYGLIQSILLMVVLYLMVILYHRTASILRCYAYLGAVESELRRDLGRVPPDVAFTREGEFYRTHKSPFAKYVAATYIAMLGSLLAAFLGVRIYTDVTSGQLLLGIVDAALAAPTLFFFVAYAKSS